MTSPQRPILTRLDDTHVLVTPSEPVAPPGLWEGPECQMCHGTGVARFIHGGGTETFARCPACNGHGQEPS